MTKVMTVSKANTSKPLLNIYFRNAFNTNQRFYLENVKWALKPNSFYHDEAAGLLYYWPATRGALPANVVAPTMDRLVDLSWANHHTITNLSFTDTTYVRAWKSRPQSVLLKWVRAHERARERARVHGRAPLPVSS